MFKKTLNNLLNIYNTYKQLVGFVDNPLLVSVEPTHPWRADSLRRQADRGVYAGGAGTRKRRCLK